MSAAAVWGSPNAGNGGGQGGSILSSSQVLFPGAGACAAAASMAVTIKEGTGGVIGSSANTAGTATGGAMGSWALGHSGGGTSGSSAGSAGGFLVGPGSSPVARRLHWNGASLGAPHPFTHMHVINLIHSPNDQVTDTGLGFRV